MTPDLEGPSAKHHEDRYTGFASPAQHHSEERISLDRVLLTNPTATFFVRVKGHAMTEAHIPDGTVLVVDRSMISDVRTGDVVVAAVDGEHLVRFYRKSGKTTALVAARLDEPEIRLREVQDHVLWGVATYAITPLTAPSRRGRTKRQRP
ncbi:MAG: translesion error-prone DNA polymerase V autoproteolytic subunit [Rhodothermales bacterium]